MARRFLAHSCCTTPAAIGYWTGAFVLLYGFGLLLTSLWPGVRPFEDTLLLAALGAACFINFGRNRTLHCSITGPIFVFGAVAAALVEGRIWTFDRAIVWGVVLVGVGIAFAIEWRTVGRNSGSVT